VNPAVELKGLNKTFGDHHAVRDLSIDVPAGSIFGLIGRNGAGKTTTIRMIMDIIRPDTGEVRLLGRAMSDGTKDRIGYLPEERGLYPKMKVIEMLEFQGSIKGSSPAEARGKATSWLERLELGSWSGRKIEELSKGMQQKVQFIAAVISSPDLLILDEPFSGMDPVNQDVFRELILELNRAGATIVFSTHVMESAEKLCREIALIDRGRVVLNGALSSIKQQFGKNSIQLEFDGDGAFLAGLPGVDKIHDYGQHVEIRLRQGADAQEILKACVGRLVVHHFWVVSPTLHNIFVQKVGKEPNDA